MYVGGCCQEKKAPRSGKNGLLEPLLGTSRLFECVSMDLISPTEGTAGWWSWSII